MEEAPNRRRIRWRNVLIIVALGSPLWYYAADILPPPDGAPTITSIAGRSIMRMFLHTFLPAPDKVTSYKGAPR